MLFVLNATRAAFEPKIAKIYLLTGRFFFLFPTLDKSHKLLLDYFLFFPVSYIYNKLNKQTNSNRTLQPLTYVTVPRQLILCRKYTLTYSYLLVNPSSVKRKDATEKTGNRGRSRLAGSRAFYKEGVFSIYKFVPLNETCSGQSP